VVQAEHRCLAAYRELRSPEVETLVAGGAPWETVLAGLLGTVEYRELAARSMVLRDLRRVLEDLLESEAVRP
jgi:hypothetical protein